MKDIKKKNTNLSLNHNRGLWSRFFDDFFGDYSGAGLELSDWSPRADFVEKEKEYLIKADLPGIDEKDLDVNFEDNILTIKGKREQESKKEEDGYTYSERSFGSFTRSFRLPTDVSIDKVNAEYKKGVLTISIPKDEKKQPKKLKVEVK